MVRRYLRVLTVIRLTEHRGFHMQRSYVAVDSHEDPSSNCYILHRISIGPEGHYCYHHMST